MRTGLLPFAILLPGMNFGQNIVLNAGFESYSGTPRFQYSERERLCPNGWINPNINSPDYYRYDNADPEIRWPHTMFGFHTPHSGSAFMGLVLFAWDGSIEQIGGTLTEPMCAGCEYEVSFWIRYAGATAFLIARDVGIRFEPNRDFIDKARLPLLENVQSGGRNADLVFSKFLPADTSWHEMRWEYRAKGGEAFFVLGMFPTLGGHSLHRKLARYRRLNADQHRAMTYMNRHQGFVKVNPAYDNLEGNRDRVAYYFVDDFRVVPAGSP